MITILRILSTLLFLFFLFLLGLCFTGRQAVIERNIEKVTGPLTGFRLPRIMNLMKADCAAACILLVLYFIFAGTILVPLLCILGTVLICALSFLYIDRYCRERPDNPHKKDAAKESSSRQ